MNIVFMGTPDFARTALSALYDAGHNITLVVTQPDKPKGRSGALVPSPVKEFASAHGLSIFQPQHIRDAEAVSRMRQEKADVFVVAAFGQILPGDVLSIPPLGCINIHASLLPALRGAAPIQAAIMEGLDQTGITIMQMDEGCDTGDILMQESVRIDDTETGGSLFDKLAQKGAELIVKALPLLAEAKLTPHKQDESKATHSGKLTKESGRIDWRKDAASIERLIRAVNPWPGAFTTREGKVLKIWKTERMSVREKPPNMPESLPGCVLSADERGITVQTGEGALCILELQAEGKKRMRVSDYLNGTPMTSGMTLGD